MSRYLASRQQKTERAYWTISSDSFRMNRTSVTTQNRLKRKRVFFFLLYIITFK